MSAMQRPARLAETDGKRGLGGSVGVHHTEPDRRQEVDCATTGTAALLGLRARDDEPGQDCKGIKNMESFHLFSLFRLERGACSDARVWKATAGYLQALTKARASISFVRTTGFVPPPAPKR